jgi:hypothetical protein
MAKLVANQGAAPGPQAVPPPGTTPSGHVQAGPQPFSVAPPNQAKSAKTPKAKREGEAKTPKIDSEQWFKDNFSGDKSDVVQIRTYPSRKPGQGFHCAGCGIAGSRAIIIKAKDPEKGQDIDLYEPDPENLGENKHVGTIKGFLVGKGCLKKYGHVDLDKF